MKPSTKATLVVLVVSVTPIKELSLQNKHKKFPIILMAHGIGATKDMGLDKFAQRFAKSGFMVLLFDYLHFGQSDGKPRRMLLLLIHAMSISRQH